jgi:hypothetical protein
MPEQTLRYGHYGHGDSLDWFNGEMKRRKPRQNVAGKATPRGCKRKLMARLQLGHCDLFLAKI